jgi:hypothetical protein
LATISLRLWINEIGHHLGMHRRFCNPRRIQNAPLSVDISTPLINSKNTIEKTVLIAGFWAFLVEFTG